MSSSIVIKCHVNEDVYMVWNRVADGPEFAGNKLALAAYLRRDRNVTEEDIKARINRAELQGTSVKTTPGSWKYGAPDGHWNDSGFVYDQQGWLPRERFHDFALALIADEDELVFLDPFEDDLYV